MPNALSLSLISQTSESIDERDTERERLMICNFVQLLVIVLKSWPMCLKKVENMCNLSFHSNISTVINWDSCTKINKHNSVWWLQQWKKKWSYNQSTAQNENFQRRMISKMKRVACYLIECLMRLWCQSSQMFSAAPRRNVAEMCCKKPTFNLKPGLLLARAS